MIVAKPVRGAPQYPISPPTCSLSSCLESVSILEPLLFYLRLPSHSFLAFGRDCLLPYAPFDIILGMIILDPLEPRYTRSGIH